jgi:hypothetical protein
MKMKKTLGLVALTITLAALGLTVIMFEGRILENPTKAPSESLKPKQTKDSRRPVNVLKRTSEGPDKGSKKEAPKSTQMKQGPINRIVFRGELGAWYQVGFLLRHIQTKRPYSFQGSDKGVMDLSRVETGRYRLTINKNIIGVSLDPRHGEGLILSIDKDKPTDHHVYVVSEFPRELVVKGLVTVNGDSPRNIFVSVSWRGSAIRLWRQSSGVYLGKSYVRRKTKPGPAKVVVNGIGIPFTTFQVKADAETQPGHFVFERDIKPAIKGVKVDVQGFVTDKKTGEPIAGGRFPIRVNDTSFSLKVNKDGQFMIKDMLSTSTFYLEDSDPSYTLTIKQNKGRWITVEDIVGGNLEIVMRTHKPSTLTLHAATSKLFDSKRIPNGAITLIPLSSSHEPFDSKRVSLITTAQERLFAEGRLDMRPLPAGLYYLVLSLTGDGTFTKRFRASGRGSSIDIDMAPTDEVYTLTLTDQNEPAQGAMVLDGVWPHASFKTAHRLFGSMKSRQSLRRVMKVPFKKAAALTNQGGHCIIERSNSANSKLTVFTKDGRCFHIPKKSGSHKLQVHKGVALSGFVTDKAGNPVQGVQVQLTSLRGGEKHGHHIIPEASEFIDRVTDAQGRYEISGIVPGEYLLCLCFSTKRVKQKGVLEKFYQVDEESLQLVTVTQSQSDFNIKMTRHVKRCAGCGLYHTDEHQ